MHSESRGRSIRSESRGVSRSIFGVGAEFPYGVYGLLPSTFGVGAVGVVRSISVFDFRILEYSSGRSRAVGVAWTE
jgi:hypothetical protein